MRSLSFSSPMRAALLLGATLLATACSDDLPQAPIPAQPDIHAADPSRGTATVEWGAISRQLVAAQKQNPFQAVRNFATLNLAQYNAVIAVDEASKGRTPISRRAAVAAASAVALSYLHPAEAANLEQKLVQQLATPGWLEPGNPDVQAGVAIGRSVGAAVVERAKTDRLFDPWTGTVPTGPGKWYSSQVPPAPPGGAGFGTARTFFLTSGAQFRPGPPPAYGSPAFVAALAEVKQVAVARTPVQDSIAKFWALPAGTYTPSGYWHEEAGKLLGQRGFGERKAAHVVALMSMAVFDALIACNDAKYEYWLLRPSQADPTITLSIGLPNFPAYPSNHACLSAAAAEVLAEKVPSERARLSALAEEAAFSRVLGGIHFRFDGDVGVDIGRKAARWAIQHDVGEHQPFPLQ